MKINQKYISFLRKYHKQIDEEFLFVEPVEHKIFDSDMVVYESKDKTLTICLGVKGPYKGWVMLRCGMQDKILFYSLPELVKYLECHRREGKSPTALLARATEMRKNRKGGEQEESPLEPSALISYVEKSEQIDLLEESYFTPDSVKMDDEIILRENIDKTVILKIINSLYEGKYRRIEINYTHNRDTESLAFLCENGKAMVWVFSDTEKYAGIFFENRNEAGMIPINKLPNTMLCGQDIMEQNVILNRSVLVSVLLAFLNHGKIEPHVTYSGWKAGMFSGRCYSNKNAYMRQRVKKGEFEL